MSNINICVLCVRSHQARSLCWWTDPVPPPSWPAGRSNAWSWTGRASSVSWARVQTSSNATSSSTTASCLSPSETPHSWKPFISTSCSEAHYRFIKSRALTAAFIVGHLEPNTRTDNQSTFLQSSHSLYSAVFLPLILSSKWKHEYIYSRVILNHFTLTDQVSFLRLVL